MSIAIENKPLYSSATYDFNLNPVTYLLVGAVFNFDLSDRIIFKVA